MAERPQPVTLPGGDFVTPGDPAALRTLVLALRQFRTSAPSLRGWRVALLAGAEKAAAAAEERLTRQRAAAGAIQTPEVLGPAQTLAASGSLGMTAAEAEDLTGLSAERWRQLAASGRVRGRQTGRRVWELDRAGVISYNEQRRRRRGTGSDTADDGESPSGRPGDGRAAA